MPKSLITSLLVMFSLSFHENVLARSVVFKGTLSGSAAANPIDMNENTMIDAFTGIIQGNSNLGFITAQHIYEIDITQSKPTTKCSADEIEALVTILSAITRHPNGDLLYLKRMESNTGVSCYNLTSNMMTYEYDLDIVGGTGRFTGATGMVHYKGNGQVLDALYLAKAGIYAPVFMSVTVDFNGEINTKK